MVDDAITPVPNGPRFYIMTSDAATGALMGALFVPPGSGLATEYLCDSIFTFFVVHGKMLVRMRLDSCGGKTARFCISTGSVCEVPPFRRTDNFLLRVPMTRRLGSGMRSRAIHVAYSQATHASSAF